MVVAPATADLLARAADGPGRRPAHQRPADRHLPGGVRAGDAHRDVAAPGHPGQRRHAARARRRRRRPRLRPADRRRLRARSAAGAGRAARRRGRACSPTRRSPSAAAARDLAGLRVAVSAGGTREHLDPVRFLGNSSSGLMGWALARAAALRGADGHAGRGERRPAGAAGRRRSPVVTSTADLAEAMTERGRGRRHRRDGRGAGRLHPGRRPATPRSRRPATPASTSTWSRPPTCWPALVAAPDRPAPGARRVRRRDRRRPSSPCSSSGRAKLARKGCDLLVLNEVGRGTVFGQPDSEIILLDRRRCRSARSPAARTRWPIASGMRPERRAASRAADCTDARRGGSDMTTQAVHLGVGDRGSPGQDRRPDQRLRPGRAAAAGPATAGSRSRRLVTTGLVVVAGEVTTEAYVGDPRASSGSGSSTSATTPRPRASTARSCGVSIAIGQQSPDIAQGVDTPSRAGPASPATRWTTRAPATRA